MLFIKYGPQGNILLLKEIQPFIISTKENAAGNFYLTGWYIDSLEIKNSPAAYSQNGSRFVGEINPNGELLWIISDEGGISLSNTSNTDFFVSGYVQQSVTLGKGQNQVTLLSQNGANYQAKYSNTGTLLWVKQLNTNLTAADFSGNFFAFERDTDFLQLSKYNQTGTQVWKRTKIKTSMHRGQMAISKNGDIFLSGAFTNQMIINDTISITGHPNNLHAFIIKFDSEGNFKWIKTSSGSGGAGAKALTVDDDNNIYITGDMQGEVVFDGITLSQPGGGIFTLKIKDNEVVASVPESKTENKNVFNVYPNPTGGTITIKSSSESNGSAGTGSIELKIENIIGQLIYHKKINTTAGLNENIDLSKYPKGVYLIEISTEQGKEVKKVVLE